jgi:hypothetical protein
MPALWMANTPISSDLHGKMQRFDGFLTAAIADFKPTENGRPQMANTGAKGFAAIMKARAAQMREEFSKLADEVNGEFAAMEGHLNQAKAARDEMKADNAELREALGLSNNPPT